MKKHISLTTQVILVIIILIIAANGILGYFMVSRSKNMMQSMISERMLDISNSAADLIDGDILERMTIEDKDSDEFKDIVETLTVFKRNINLEYIYCVIHKGYKNFVFGIDPDEVDPANFGDPVVYTDALYKASLGTAAVCDEPYEDAWGTFYSAYSPVFDSLGNVAGIIAVDFSADWYNAQIRSIVLTVMTCSTLSLLLGGLIIFLVTYRIRKRFKHLNTELTDLADEVDKLTSDLEQSSEAAPEKDENARDKIKQNDDMVNLGERIRSTRGELMRYINHLNTREKNMITALASDYRSVYYVDLDSDSGICYRSGSGLPESVAEGDSFVFSSLFETYANQYVSEEYREEFLRFASPEFIRENLEQEPILSCQYLAVRPDRELYEMLRIAGIRNADRGDTSVHEISIGFTDVDRETRESMNRNRALSEALAVAKESSQAKSAFLSNMSHEIRTPMNAIIGLDTIALADPDVTPKLHDLLGKIGISANHLLSLINDILDMSRIESGRMTLRKDEFSFKETIDQVNTIIGEQCKQKSITYTCTISEDVAPYYIGDDVKLKQILINILGNSVKFTPDGGEVSLTAERIEHFDRHSTLRFSMKDTGIGMDKEFIPKIFDAFSQEDSSFKTKLGSTGLGMAITKRIVEMMNGDIVVESEKGVGSDFIVTVTLLDSGRTTADPQDNISLKDLRVLVAESEGVARACARMALEELGVDTAITVSCNMALSILHTALEKGKPHNLIIIDRNLPDADSVTAVSRIREVTGDDPVVILTADGPDALTQQEIAAGANGLLSLPIYADELIQEIRRAKHQPASEDTPEQTTAVDLTGRRVLLAEDMPINAEIMSMLLDMRGVKMDHAENGSIAVEKFSSHPAGYYAAILMDMRMPEMDGLTATTIIRSSDHPDAERIPIIALTANAFDEDVQRSLQVGLNAHLSKPVDADKLFSTLTDLIKE